MRYPPELQHPAEVHPGLYLAGSRWPYPPLDLDLVVTVCEPHEVWHAPQTRREIVEPMKNHQLAPADRIYELVDEVTAALDRDERVMVRCHWGVERSAMIVALAMLQRTRAGLYPILGQLQERRSVWVLENSLSPSWRFVVKHFTEGRVGT